MGCAGTKIQKVEHVQAILFFRSMNTELITRFSSLFSAKKFKQGQYIFAQGERGVHFYVIAEGTVDITVNEAEKPKLLCTKRKGDFFGDTALNFQCGHIHFRDVNAVAGTFCSLLILSQAKFRDFLLKVPIALQHQITTYTTLDVQKVLRSIPLFSSLPVDKVKLLSHLFRYISVKEGEDIFQEGEVGHSMYIVADGLVCPHVGRTDSVERLKLTDHDMGPGSYFGEIALLMGVPRTATVSATADSLLLQLCKIDFVHFMELVPQAKDQLKSLLSERVASLFRKFHIPFFAALSRDKFSELCREFTIVEVEAGQPVVRQGEVGDKFYLLAHGCLRVEKDGTAVGEISPGQYFGEIALVTDKKRAASVSAHVRSVVLALDKERFRSFFASNPRAWADFALKLSREKAPLVAVLLHPAGRVYFEKHVLDEFSSENLEFWKEAGHFEALPANKLAAEGKRLLEVYIAPGSPHMVNIPSSDVKIITQAVECGRVTSSTFKAARNEILKLMSTDSYKRFKKSAMFTELLQTVGSYDSGQTDEALRSSEIERKLDMHSSEKFSLKKNLLPSQVAQLSELLEEAKKKTQHSKSATMDFSSINVKSMLGLQRQASKSFSTDLPSVSGAVTQDLSVSSGKTSSRQSKKYSKLPA
eukprot:CAMPEP_0175122586 /NCGR_PEP_ID=MMETSP0087-20121206/1796_1 /TAXON_ID=136419 /ORGANISM="Unknown Unknown, Strain D1" /LENGTH=644 /DNA_ID=CAMNT_0016404235 /DNA_START=23 /DNA_END=1957 /DNA_ORIENTATION=+